MTSFDDEAGREFDRPTAAAPPPSDEWRPPPADPSQAPATPPNPWQTAAGPPPVAAWQNPAGAPPPGNPWAPSYLGVPDQSTGFGEPPPPPRKSHKGRWIAAGTAAAVLIAGGVVGAYAYSALSGGGAQPESVLPSTTIAFAKVDLDPAANQKIAVYRLSKKFPGTSGIIPNSDSVKDSVLNSILGDASIGLDYNRDIKPWLGDRAATAAVPDSSSDNGVDAVAVLADKDDSKMRTALNKYIATNPDSPIGYVTDHGYVLISDTQAHAQAAVDAANSGGTLDKTADFAGDVGSLHGDQIAEAWFNAGALAKALPGGSSLTPTTSKARFVMGLHADANYIELDGSTRGTTATAMGTVASKVESLPANTTAAVEVTGIGPTFAKDYAMIPASQRQLLDQFALAYHLSLPADLAAILGTDMLVSVGPVPAGSTPPVAVQTATADPARALASIDYVLTGLGADPEFSLPPLDKQASKDGYVISNDPAYLKTLQGKPATTLGSTADFKKAVPNAANAGAVGYVSFDALRPSFGPQDQANLKNVAAAGFSVSADGSSFDARLVVN